MSVILSSVSLSRKQAQRSLHSLRYEEKLLPWSFLNSSYGNEASIFFSEISEMYAGSITPEECAKAIQASLVEYQEMNK